MTLERGRRLGPYEVLAPLGAGGMGEVWRATDTRLGREVALKLLPAAFAADPDRLARFEREAQLLASLSHTHIAGLFALEEATLEGGATPVRFLAMELAEGEDLAERLKRGQVPVDEAIAIAKQIAEALEAAHEKGIVHRDLKPANVKVSGDGHVKVLDFGLAKAWSSDGVTDSSDWSRSPTLARTGTAAGVILGTAAYMSPEQARGKPADKRADIWSFGVVLFEMLTGKRLFDGETVSDVLAAVLTREPQWNELPDATPASVRRLLRRCLERNPRNRQHDIADARVALDEALREGPEEAAAAVAQRMAPPWRRALPWAVAGSLAAALALDLWAPWRPAPEPAKPVRVSVELGADATLATAGLGTGTAAILSPDGSVLAFVAHKDAGERPQLYVRRLESLQASPLSGTENARNPFFSVDGQWIAYFADGKLKKIAVTGGAAVTLCDAPDDRGGTWSEDGTIVFAPEGRGGLSRVSGAGGIPEVVTTPDPAAEEITHRWPQALPGGKAVLYTAHRVVGDFEDATIVVKPLPSGPPRVLQRGGYHGRYLGSGHLVYVHEGTLFAAPFDPGRLELRGQSVPALEGVAAAPGFAGAHFALSNRGTLVFLPGPRLDVGGQIRWVDREGKTQPLQAPPGRYRSLRFSPDGRKLAIDILEGRQRDVWVYEWGRDSLSRLTFDPALDQAPVWTPDGRGIAFASDRAERSRWNLYWQRADGTGDAERLTEGKNPQWPMSWHPTGKFLAFQEQQTQTSFDIMILPMEGDATSGWKPGKPVAFLNSTFAETSPAFSPDGRWLAYQSNDTGSAEVYVRPFPGPGGKWQISTSGGRYATWSRTGKELLYQVDDASIWAATYVVEGNSFRAERPRMWTSGRLPPPLLPLAAGAFVRAFDLHPDGQRLAVLAPEEQTAARRDHVVLIQNFFDELRRLAPPTKR